MKVICIGIDNDLFEQVTVGKVYEILIRENTNGGFYPVFGGTDYIIMNDEGNEIFISNDYFIPLRKHNLDKLI
jgi:hypothetical protein